ncbi:unnamed protein product [Rotaria sp. Silwood2]|nr:unnamed protein product [Rotaria sp. Silwood2]CAF4585493.1 unnamed protein product [Rotaria sp. Silwood2]CAF4722957.1 unnamed protein product [Rotaria sp. Silwood2]
MGFFIRSLHRQLEQLHHEQSGTSNKVFIVYRDESLSGENFQHLLSTKDGLLAFNTFLSTSIVGIVGPVGSGKSSLLVAILGEMNIINGKLNTNGSTFAYTSQSSWIFADTLRNNILLNQTFDQQRYRDIIYACCLDVDLGLLGSSGDLTIIGERGVNISGGQKARVS